MSGAGPPGPFEDTLSMGPSRTVWTSGFTSGVTLGPYRLIQPLGSGGFGEVWEAEKSPQGFRLALKLLRHAATRDAIRRFEEEGRLAARLSHPRCVYVYAAAVFDGIPCIAMELVEGGTLADRVARDGSLDPHVAIEHVLDVLEGLIAAQRFRIVHRDIKPSNCFLDRAGRAKLGDFGIARSLEEPGSPTKTVGFVGTPLFAAPEQLRGLPTNAASDQYSLGATLFTLLAGRPPFESRERDDFLAQILGQPPPSVDALRKGLPRGLSAIVSRMLEKDPMRRFPDLEAVRSALESYSSGGRVSAPPSLRLRAALVDIAFVMLLAIILDLAVGLIETRFANQSRLMAGLTFRQWGGIVLATILCAGPTLAIWRWQGTPGQQLLRLRVRDEQGGRATFIQAAVRSTTVVLPLFYYVVVSGAMLGPTTSGAGVLLGLLGAVFVPMTLASTARRSNGYAAIQDLLSRTRLRMAAPPLDRDPVRSSVSASVAKVPESNERGASTHPLRLVRKLWETEHASLLLAVDERLGRSVWWLDRPTAGTPDPSPTPGGTERRTQVRRLDGGVSGDRTWEVFEVPGGRSLRDELDAGGATSWPVLRGWLLALTLELSARVAAGEAHSVTMDMLWVDAHGGLRVLDFPCRPATSGLAEPEDWRGLMLDVTRRALTAPGRDPHGPTQLDQAWLPARAGELLQELSRPRPGAMTLDEFARDLESAHDLDSRVRPGRRAIGIVLGSPLGFSSLIATADAVLARPSLLRDAETRFYLIEWVLFFFTLCGLAGLALGPLTRGGPMLRLLGMRVVTGSGRPAGRARCLARGVFAMLPALLWLAPCVVGAIATRTAGVAMQARAEVSVAGGTIAARGSVARWFKERRVFQAEFARLTGVPSGWLYASGTVALVILFAGGAYVALRPAQGIPDVLAGTRIVPR